MQINGENCCRADAASVYNAILNPTRLAVALLGCKTLSVTEHGVYTGQLALGVGPMAGNFDATVHVLEQQSPSYLRMEAKAKGFAGLVKFTMVLHLNETEGVTQIAWVVDADVSGPVASVGSRLLGGVTRFIADQFFTALLASEG